MLERQKTWARELSVLLITLSTAMTGWMVWNDPIGQQGVANTFLVSAFGFLTAAFIKAGWESHKADELEAQMTPEEAPDPVPPKGFGE